MSHKPLGSQNSGTRSALPPAPRRVTVAAYSVVIIFPNTQSAISIFHVYLFCHFLCICAPGGVTLLKCHSLVLVFIRRPFQRNRKPQGQYRDYAVMVVSLAVLLVVGTGRTDIPYVFEAWSGNNYSQLPLLRLV